MLISSRQHGFAYLEALIAVSAGWMVCYSVLQALNNSAHQLAQSASLLQRKRTELSFSASSLGASCASLELPLTKSALTCTKAGTQSYEETFLVLN